MKTGTGFNKCFRYVKRLHFTSSGLALMQRQVQGVLHEDFPPVVIDRIKEDVAENDLIPFLLNGAWTVETNVTQTTNTSNATLEVLIYVTVWVVEQDLLLKQDIAERIDGARTEEFVHNRVLRDVFAAECKWRGVEVTQTSPTVWAVLDKGLPIVATNPPVTPPFSGHIVISRRPYRLGSMFQLRSTALFTHTIIDTDEETYDVNDIRCTLLARLRLLLARCLTANGSEWNFNYSCVRSSFCLCLWPSSVPNLILDDSKSSKNTVHNTSLGVVFIADGTVPGTNAPKHGTLMATRVTEGVEPFVNVTPRLLNDFQAALAHVRNRRSGTSISDSLDAQAFIHQLMMFDQPPQAPATLSGSVSIRSILDFLNDNSD